MIKITEDIKTCVRCTVNEEVTYCEVGGEKEAEVDGDKLDSERVTMEKEIRFGVHGREAECVRRSKQRRRSGSRGGQATMKEDAS